MLLVLASVFLNSFYVFIIDYLSCSDGSFALCGSYFICNFRCRCRCIVSVIC
jgi:hypothetical protein